MATIGQEIIVPENGWKRYDDLDFHINYTAGVNTAVNNCVSGTGLTYLDTIGASMTFRFKGTGIIILGWLNNDFSSNISIQIDNENIETITAHPSNGYVTTVIGAMYVKTGLLDEIHKITLSNTDNLSIRINAIDIFGGYLVHPLLTEKQSVSDLSPGDSISCEYIATSGAVGTFSNLGKATKALIPAASSATPNGSFQFIHAGYDVMGNKLLVADRNIQHGITWDTLNVAGLGGSGLDIGNSYKWQLADDGSSIAYSTTRSSYSISSCVYNNELYVVWCEINNTSPYPVQVRLKKWNGTTWTFVDGGGAYGINYVTANSAYNASLSVYNGELYIFWSENSATYDIRYKKYNGTSFTNDYGTALNTLSNNIAQSADFGSYVYNNKLFIFYTSYIDGYSKLYVKMYDGATWSWVYSETEAAILNYTNNSANTPSICSDGINLYLSFVENSQIKLRIYDEVDNFLPYLNGGSINYDNTKPVSRAQLLNFKNELYCFWDELSTTYTVRSKKLVDGSWVSIPNDNNICKSPTFGTFTFRGAVVVEDYIYILYYVGIEAYVSRYNGLYGESFDDNTYLNFYNRSFNSVHLADYNNKLILSAIENNGSQTVPRVKYATIFDTGFAKANLRLLSGGSLATNTDNEWDKIITLSTLDGKITAGDNAIWNWSGIASWTSSAIVATNTNRVFRGNAAVSTWAAQIATTLNATTGFRPILVVSDYSKPQATYSINKNIAHKNVSAPLLTSGLTSASSSMIQHRILLNKYFVISDWSAMQTPPVSISYQIPSTNLLVGLINYVTVEYKSFDDYVGRFDIPFTFYDNDLIAVLNAEIEMENSVPILKFSIDNSDDHSITYIVGQYNSSNELISTIKTVNNANVTTFNGGKITIV